VLRELAGRAGTVLSLDRSIGMLRQAPSSVPRVQADVVSAPLRRASADVVVLAFVLFLIPDARAAVAEAARVLRPGGWLLAATWGNQSGTGADDVVREELDAAHAPEFPPLVRSDDLTNSPERMAALLADDFRDVQCWARPLDARFTAESALAMRTGCGHLGWRYARLDAATQATVRARITHRLRALPDDGFVDRSEVLLTKAHRR
jgi:SAM-dependent methyltransferase